MSLSDSGVAWYSKNYVILNTQPEGSEPSKQGTSSFIRGGLTVEFGGVGMANEEEGDGEWWIVVSRAATRRRRSSSFSVT